jgi:hypothetical protein
MFTKATWFLRWLIKEICAVHMQIQPSRKKEPTHVDSWHNELFYLSLLSKSNCTLRCGANVEIACL